MLSLVYLGTGAALPTPGRDNTSLAIDDGEDVTLVDTSAAPFERLVRAGLSPDLLVRVIITHQHLDHTYGLPSLLQSLWLSGRTTPLVVCAEEQTWPFLDRFIDVFRPTSWADAFPIERCTIASNGAPFLETGRLRVRASPGQHSVPTVGLRFESAGGSITYSSDTSPCESIVELAKGSSMLLHEATFLGGQEAEAARFGHSTGRQAGEVAAAAGVARLALVHFTPRAPSDLEVLRRDAASAYEGPIDVPSDGDRFVLG